MQDNQFVYVLDESLYSFASEGWYNDARSEWRRNIYLSWLIRNDRVTLITRQVPLDVVITLYIIEDPSM